MTPLWAIRSHNLGHIHPITYLFVCLSFFFLFIPATWHFTKTNTGLPSACTAATFGAVILVNLSCTNLPEPPK